MSSGCQHTDTPRTGHIPNRCSNTPMATPIVSCRGPYSGAQIKRGHVFSEKQFATKFRNRGVRGKSAMIAIALASFGALFVPATMSAVAAPTDAGSVRAAVPATGTQVWIDIDTAESAAGSISGEIRNNAGWVSVPLLPTVFGLGAVAAVQPGTVEVRLSATTRSGPDLSLTVVDAAGNVLTESRSRLALAGTPAPTPPILPDPAASGTPAPTPPILPDPAASGTPAPTPSVVPNPAASATPTPMPSVTSPPTSTPSALPSAGPSTLPGGDPSAFPTNAPDPAGGGDPDEGAAVAPAAASVPSSTTTGTPRANENSAEQLSNTGVSITNGSIAAALLLIIGFATITVRRRIRGNK
jgi:hypothetical protein